MPFNGIGELFCVKKSTRCIATSEEGERQCSLRPVHSLRRSMEAASLLSERLFSERRFERWCISCLLWAMVHHRNLDKGCAPGSPLRCLRAFSLLCALHTSPRVQSTLDAHAARVRRRSASPHARATIDACALYLAPRR